MTQTNVRSNYIYSLLYRLSICILPLLITPYTARVLGSEKTGLYAFSSCVTCYFILFGKLGLDNYGSRSIACVQENLDERSQVFWSIYTLQSITSMLSITVYLGVVFLFFRNDLQVYLMQLPYVFSALFDVSWFFYGMEQFRLTTLRSLTVRILIVAGVFGFVHEPEDVWLYTLILSGSFLLEQLLLLPILPRYVHPVRVHWADICIHLLPNLKLFLPLAVLSIYNWMDKLMVGVIAGNEQVAFYNYADSIINLPKGIVMALGTVLLPRVSRMAADEQQDKASHLLKDSVTFTSFLCCMLCFGIAAVAPVFIPLFLGQGYEDTIRLTMGMALVMLPLGLSDTLQNQYLIPFQRESVYTSAVTVGAAANLLLNRALIPLWGSDGAVVGTIGAAFTVLFCQMYGIRNVFRWRDLQRAVWPFVVCGVLEFAAAYSLCRLALPAWQTLLLQLLTGGIVYMSSCTALVLLCRRDLRHLLDFLR